MKKRLFKPRIIALLTVFSVSVFSLTGCGWLLTGCLALLDDEPYSEEAYETAPSSNSTYNNEKYAYNTLDEQSKRVYNELYEGIVNMEDEIDISTSDESVFVKVTECIDADHGNIFYTDGYS